MEYHLRLNRRRLKYLYLVILSLSFHANAFQYEPKDLSFSLSSYRRYIRPQLKSLIQDYQTLYKSLSPAQDIAAKQIKLTLDWYETSYQVNAYCLFEKMNNNCEKLIQKTYQDIKETLIHLEEMSRKLPFANLKKIKHLSTVQNIAYKLEDLAIGLKTATNNKDKKELFSKLATELAGFLETNQKLSLNLVGKAYQEQISLVELNFFIPVINNFIADDKPDNLYSLTKDLNKSFHHFLMELLKKGRPITPKVKTLLEVMQRRWNSVLKITVKR